VLVNFGESVNFPLLFALALSVFGAATLLHLLLVSVARRRVEAGLLKVLGFVRRQVAAAVCWQATAVVEPVLMAALVAGVLAAANLLAAGPALLAARSHPARLLRAE
jgi:FtsX-like permease family